MTTIGDDDIKGARILIADDEPRIVQVLTTLLERAGYRSITTTSDSSEVLELVRTTNPDLLVLDLTMPPPDGYEILEQLQSTIPEDSYFPILVLTASARPEAKLRSLVLGAKDFVAKPFDMLEVMLRIRMLLHTRLLFRRQERQNRLR